MFDFTRRFTFQMLLIFSINLMLLGELFSDMFPFVPDVNQSEKIFEELCYGCKYYISYDYI